MMFKVICIYFFAALVYAEEQDTLLADQTPAPFKQDVKPGEFPYVALVGYSRAVGHDIESGSSEPNAGWRCGGSVISGRFVLIAGQCAHPRQSIKLTHVAVGVIRRSDIQPSHVYRVKSIHSHPEYKQQIGYNDIAIVETEDTFNFTSNVQPACISDTVEDDTQAVVIGLAEAIRPEADVVMQKISVNKIKSSECSELYPIQRQLPMGIDSTTLVCYGGPGPVTANGDAGTPVQVLSNNSKCKHSVIGILSFGKQKGGNTDVYTRVAPYLPWINSVVKS